MNLPVQKVLPQLEQALVVEGSAVLVAPPGSGKTTFVPLVLRNASWLGEKKILMLEPRRIAVRLAAGYMSHLLGEKVGSTVGYQVRFDRRVTPGTRVEVITEGILTRRLQQDPELAEIGLVIFDEFHERSLDSDLAFTLCLDMIGGLREDLRLLVMSATMDAEPVSRLLGNAPVITGQGRMYPVEVEYLSPLSQFDSSRPDHLARTTVRAIRQILDQERGDMLVFLPGIGEINRVQQQLTGFDDLIIRPLHGSLKPAEQEKAIRPDPTGRQRIILATTIAETSITIEGITVVVDCGWKRVPRFDANSGLSRLDTVRISRSSAEQRAGRAGRLGPGTCYRLWNMAVDACLQEFDLPEIRQADLASLVLELANWGVRDPARLCWLDPPPESSFQQGKELLIRLGGLDREGLTTPLGRQMAALPLHPRLARMVLLAGSRNRKQAVDLAALLSERDVLPKSDSADLDNRLYCLQRFRSQGMAAVHSMGGHPGGCAQVDRVSRQLTARLKNSKQKQTRLLSIGGLLGLAYPDRIGKRRTSNGRSYKLVSGRGGQLQEHDPLAASEWMVVTSQDVRSRDGRIFLAASIELSEIEELFAGELTEREEVSWDSGAQSVISRRSTCLGELVVAEKKITDPDQEAVQAALVAGIRELGLDVLPWTSAARLLQARVGCLGEWQPEENWLDFSDGSLLDGLEQWLGPHLHGVRNIKGCGLLNLEKILLAGLDFRQQQLLDRNAPTHIRVPSGSRVKLLYQVGQLPVLAVRLQEMFGLAETPTICQGRIQVVLHLLSPARRPVQVTRDLQGFWDSSYFEVRKELKGRYPKHHWPEEPWKAVATARTKPRKKK
ncbi:MAG: ATP-dependent helicase HrpB [Deltaproteobacteria bacterium]|nr:ATP-dependent helicase HrpB [Deltaproteobacteria bacterium]